MSGAITEFAPAKINLSLRVGRVRGGGYHARDSLVSLAAWGDTITVRDEIALMMSMSGEASEDLIEEENNLVLQAARALQDHAGIDKGAIIHLHKEIPVAAGLGGGSADAAATLRALNQLWELGLTRQELQALGLQLGADVPVFIYGKSSFAEGVGEQLQPLKMPKMWFLVLKPPVSVPTETIFSHSQLTRDTRAIKMPSVFSNISCPFTTAKRLRIPFNLTFAI